MLHSGLASSLLLSETPDLASSIILDQTLDFLRIIPRWRSDADFVASSPCDCKHPRSDTIQSLSRESFYQHSATPEPESSILVVF
jgi:hypothetical protein